MPGFDGLGPLGMGTMTGRGRGYCMTFVTPGAGFTQGFCRGGGGRGMRRRYYATGLPRWARQVPVDPVVVPQESSGQMMETLKDQIACMEKSLEQIKKRINEMESGQ